MRPDMLRAEASIAGSGEKDDAQNTPEDPPDDIIIDEEAEKRLIRKLDSWIVPPVRSEEHV